MFSIFKVTFNGRNGIGPISAPGVKVGDVVLRFYRTDGSANEAYYYFTVTTDDEINQRFSGDATFDTGVVALVVRLA